jgi:hypothetical protein
MCRLHCLIVSSNVLQSSFTKSNADVEISRKNIKSKFLKLREAFISLTYSSIYMNIRLGFNRCLSVEFYQIPPTTSNAHGSVPQIMDCNNRWQRGRRSRSPSYLYRPTCHMSHLKQQRSWKYPSLHTQIRQFACYQVYHMLLLNSPTIQPILGWAACQLF